MIIGTTVGMELGARLVMYLEQLGLADSHIRKAYVIFLALIGSYVLYDYLSHVIRGRKAASGKQPPKPSGETMAMKLQRIKIPPSTRFFTCSRTGMR